MNEDRALLRRLRGGDRDVLKIIYETYKRDMLAVALALASDRSAAEDAVHDVFVSFAGIARVLKVRKSLKSYLLASVVHRLRNAAKSAGRNVSLSVLAEPVAFAPETPAAASHEAERLSRTLAALPDPQRSVVILHVLEGLRFRAIAEAQGASINTVLSRYRYGMKKMRGFMTEEKGRGE